MTGLRPGYPRFCLGEAGARSCLCRPCQPTRRVLRIVLQCDGRVVTIHHQKVDLRIGFFGNRLEVQFPGSETLSKVAEPDTPHCVKGRTHILSLVADH